MSILSSCVWCWRVVGNAFWRNKIVKFSTKSFLSVWSEEDNLSVISSFDNVDSPLDDFGCIQLSRISENKIEIGNSTGEMKYPLIFIHRCGEWHQVVANSMKRLIWAFWFVRWMRNNSMSLGECTGLTFIGFENLTIASIWHFHPFNRCLEMRNSVVGSVAKNLVLFIHGVCLDWWWESS